MKKPPILLMIFGAIGVLLMFAKTDYNAPTVSDACVNAQAAVEDRLRAPASATFSLCDAPNVAVAADGTWTVAGQVDSQNAFGAMIRSDYVAHLTHAGTQWEIADVSIGSEP